MRELAKGQTTEYYWLNLKGVWVFYHTAVGFWLIGQPNGKWQTQRNRSTRAEVWSHLKRDTIFMASPCPSCWMYRIPSVCKLKYIFANCQAYRLGPAHLLPVSMVCKRFCRSNPPRVTPVHAAYSLHNLPHIGFMQVSEKSISTKHYHCTERNTRCLTLFLAVFTPCGSHGKK